MLKKITSGILSAVLLIGSAGAVGSGYNPVGVDAADVTPNYAEALQKSLFFYECQQAGPLPEWNRVEWKADSTMIDEVLGGWYDAGDHVKFNLPMAYTASMLAWGMYQYPDGLEKCGEMNNYVNNLEFVLDYLAECDRGDEAVFQVGNGTIDHTWWGPVEVYEYGISDSASYKAAREVLTASKGCSAVFGEMAAALAAGCCALEGKLPQSKLDNYLAHAENLFGLADASKSNDVYNDSNASNFYRSSHFYDDLFYAANWLYIATDDRAYLDKATGYIPSLDKELGQDVLKYTWCQCWDDVMQGGMLLYAMNTKDSTYIDHVEKHVNYWTNSITKVDGLLGYCDTWGCARYAEAAAFLAAVACDTVLAGRSTDDYVKFYETQINYVLGVNPSKQSYVVGYGENSPINPHHRTAHGSWKNDLAIPEQNRHILYGALVGGPNQNGSYEDDRQNYINNEVATDYNAGFTAILCKMIDKYGGTTDPNFPEPEQHDGPEFFVETLVKQGSASGVVLSFKITNHSAWPARVQDNISMKYFMDMSEIIEAGYSPSDVVIRCDRDQSAMYASEGVATAEITGPIQYDGNIYYVEVKLPDGRAALPISEGRQQCEILLAFVYPNYGSGWNAENDFSNTGILNSEDSVVSEYVPVYLNGELYYGREPDGSYADGGVTVKPTEPTTKPTSATTATTVTTEPTTKPTSATTATTVTTEPTTEVPPILWGDATIDGKVLIDDVVLVMSYTANPTGTAISDEGLRSADVYQNGDGVQASDAASIQKYLTKVIAVLPES